MPFAPGAVAFPDVTAIVVTWNPDIAAFRHAWSSYAARTRVLIVDNGSRPEIVAALRELESATCSVIALPTNLGIASAINAGVAHVEQTNPAFYLLLDQDSVFEPDTLPALLEASHALRQSGIGRPVVGPLPVEKESGVMIGMYGSMGLRAGDRQPFATESLYTSGMLVPADLAREAPQKEAFFIDYVDTEWCYRVAKLHGAHTYVVPHAVIRHKVGDTALPLHVRHQPLLVHGPIRQYFQLRNAIWMLACDYIPVRTRWRMALRCLARVSILAACVAPRLTRMRFVGCAMIDGLRGKAGRWRFLPRGAQLGADRPFPH
ncbi:glycosyltransferase [Cupriavidus sp. WGtm5]|uniref:glycosyltransferase n=1 Tax=Cupriavidus sp. WGtm5 TaxID=2919926 RepID=UPI00209096EE|nr:glycosyltransferase [Cupriavidus sp. WGtm5]MCO4888765.1 glycosyltransferase [Cupriavidus sp. WGtm5]